MRRLLLPLLLSILAFAVPASAAQFYFGAASQSVVVGQQIEVGVLIDTQGEQINAIQGDVVFSPKGYHLDAVRDGNTVISNWIQSPAAVACTDTCDIPFSGIVPGGFHGQQYLFSLILTVQSPADVSLGTISIHGEKALLNDGQGTAAKTSVADLSLKITKTGTPTSLPPVIDTIPPQEFTPIVAQDPNAFDGKWFVTFQTQDKESGIDHYEVRERTSAADDSGQWVVATNPYVLKDQSRASFVDVKAIDRAGNERIETVAPSSQNVPWYENWAIWVILVVFILFVVWKLWSKRKRRSSSR